jgi:hypothetical protein
MLQHAERKGSRKDGILKNEILTRRTDGSVLVVLGCRIVIAIPKLAIVQGSVHRMQAIAQLS